MLRWALGTVVALVLFAHGPTAAAEPGTMRTPEVLTHKPSGFWTSTRPAEGGAYRYRLLGIGVALVLITGLVTLRVLKRTPPPKRRI
jgi:hypothetical protein